MPRSSVELQWLRFHGGDTGSTPVRDANIVQNQPNHCPTNTLKKHLHNLVLRLQLSLSQRKTFCPAAFLCEPTS